MFDKLVQKITIENVLDPTTQDIFNSEFLEMFESNDSTDNPEIFEQIAGTLLKRQIKNLFSHPTIMELIAKEDKLRFLGRMVLSIEVFPKDDKNEKIVIFSLWVFENIFVGEDSHVLLKKICIKNKPVTLIQLQKIINMLLMNMVYEVYFGDKNTLVELTNFLTTKFDNL